MFEPYPYFSDPSLRDCFPNNQVRQVSKYGRRRLKFRRIFHCICRCNKNKVQSCFGENIMGESVCALFTKVGKAELDRGNVHE